MTRIKIAIIAVAFIGAAFTSCKKEEQGVSPQSTVKPVSKPQGNTLDTEDNPKSVKGKIKNGYSEEIEGAVIYLRVGTTVIDTAYSNDTGVFETDVTVTAGSYNIVVQAAGYQERTIPFVVPEDETTVFDLEDIIMVVVDPS